MSTERLAARYPRPKAPLPQVWPPYTPQKRRGFGDDVGGGLPAFFPGVERGRWSSERGACPVPRAREAQSIRERGLRSLRDALYARESLHAQRPLTPPAEKTRLGLAASASMMGMGA